jgi:nucleotide-binding universal stress UspA family protein
MILLAMIMPTDERSPLAHQREVTTQSRSRTAVLVVGLNDSKRLREKRREEIGVFPRILVPIDLSDRNARSLKLALALARDGPASVTLLHVVQQVRGVPPGEMRAFYGRLVEASRRKLARAAKLFAAQGITVRSKVLVGEPAREIVRTAAAARADLIVMGSHRVNPKRRGMGWGTTSYKVGILCRCPILLVK